MKVLLFLLGVCKWIGIVLLVLLLLFLLLTLVVLLSPLRYRLAGEKEEEISGSFAVSWLFGAVRCEGSYTKADDLQMKLKVLWFTLLGGEPKEKKKRRPKKQPQTEEPQPIFAAENIEPQKPESPPKQPEPRPLAQKTEEPAKTVRQPKTMRRVKLSEIEESPPEEPLFSEEETFFTGETPPEGEKGKILPVLRKIWAIEEKDAIFAALKKLLKRLMKGILPGNLFLKGTVGTGDPATTGYILALAAMLTAKFGNDIQIKGDFTKPTLEDLEIRIKGKIVLGNLLWAVLAFVLTRPVRRLLVKLWKERKKAKE